MLDLMNGGKCMSGIDAVEFFERLAEGEDIYDDVKTPEFCDEYECALNRLRYEVRESAAKDQQTAMLEKAFEMSCRELATGYCCPIEFNNYECEKCKSCSHHTDTYYHTACWKDYFMRENADTGGKEMKKACKSCGWGRQTLNSDTIFICGCPLSGAYGTHVIESDGCDRWKKASDEYLKLVGCLEDSNEKT